MTHYRKPTAASVYANEWDRHAARWLSCLPLQFDEIDTRSIEFVQGCEIEHYIQCHFFAGIGGWPLALEIAGWPVDAPVWTGSCPCQPFSQAGKRKGTADERHLWPEFRRLIDECRPATIFGEQVASEDGRNWLSDVRTDLEALGYAVGAADLCAAGVGAPHIRQRLFWVAHSDKYRRSERREDFAAEKHDGPKRDGTSSGLANGQSDRREQGITNNRGSDSRIRTQREFGRPAWDGSNIEFVPCRDGKARPVKPGVRLLVNGVSGRVAVCRSTEQGSATIQETHEYARVGALKGFGNAIVPQVAAEFIAAFMETQHATP